MRSLFIIAALAGSLPLSLGFAKGQEGTHAEAPSQTPAVDASDRKFLGEAALGNIYEIKLGQLASKHAVNEDIKKYGQRMVDDHTKLNSDLSKLAQQKGVTLLSTLDKEHQEQVDKLAK